MQRRSKGNKSTTLLQTPSIPGSLPSQNGHGRRAGQRSNYHDYHSVTPPTVPQNEARSAAEENLNGCSKNRQLPCKTFIMNGTCPYRERCTFLHDPRCICKGAKTRLRKKMVGEDNIPDSLFWPVMPMEMVTMKLDGHQPHVIQHYQTPYPKEDSYKLHDRALYSVWYNFLDSCMANANSNPTTCFRAPNDPINFHTGVMRLSVFRLLSKSLPVKLPLEYSL